MLSVLLLGSLVQVLIPRSWLRVMWRLFWNTIPLYIVVVLLLCAARVWLFPHTDGAVG